jgi:hypothetical protein
VHPAVNASSIHNSLQLLLPLPKVAELIDAKITEIGGLKRLAEFVGHLCSE